MAELAPGSQFGGYRIEAIAGQGGMGVVYRATQLTLDRMVGLKVITPVFATDEEFRARFKRESKLAASIEHPNVIPVYEAGEHDGVLFLAMRFVEGTDLGSLMKREGRLEPIRATRFVAQIAAALDAAHGAGLVHRDVKPANALVAGDDHVYLTDFGLTKRAASGSAMTKTGQMVGTVDYVAPEQVEGGSVDARTDVYSLGCVLFHLLTGRVPFDKNSEMAKLFAHVNEPPPAPSEYVPGLPPELDEVVARGMAKAPADRYLSAGDLGRAAVAAAEHRALAETAERSVARGDAAPVVDPGAPTSQRPAPVVAADSAPPGDAPASGGGRRKVWAAAAAGVVVLGVIVALAAGGGGGGGGGSSSGSGGTVVPVTRAGALDTANSFAAGVNETNITEFEDLYKGNFSETRDLETCTGSGQPMNLDAALAEWQCLFEQFQDSSTSLAMTMSGQTTDLTKKTLQANYVLKANGKDLASGKVQFHLIPGVDFPRMDKVVFSDGTGTFKPAASTKGAAAADTAPITRSGAINTARGFAAYYEDENLQGLEELSADGFKLTDDGETCTASEQPMAIDAALEEYSCWFDELALPAMTLNGIKVDLAKRTVTSGYKVVDKGKAVRIGKITMHLVPAGADKEPLIDRLAYTAG